MGEAKHGSRVNLHSDSRVAADDTQVFALKLVASEHKGHGAPVNKGDGEPAVNALPAAARLTHPADLGIDEKRRPTTSLGQK
jgi:hypothetical protein